MSNQVAAIVGGGQPRLPRPEFFEGTVADRTLQQQIAELRATYQQLLQASREPTTGRIDPMIRERLDALRGQLARLVKQAAGYGPRTPVSRTR